MTLENYNYLNTSGEIKQITFFGFKFHLYQSATNELTYEGDYVQNISSSVINSLSLTGYLNHDQKYPSFLQSNTSEHISGVLF